MNKVTAITEKYEDSGYHPEPGEMADDVETIISELLNEVQNLKAQNEMIISLALSRGDGGDDGCFVYENVEPPSILPCRNDNMDVDICEKCVMQWAAFWAQKAKEESCESTGGQTNAE